MNESESIVNSELDESVNIYGLPLGDEAKIEGMVYESSSHSGWMRGAIDIAVRIGTKVLCPLEGVVIHVRDHNDQHGTSIEDARFNNFIEIQHPNGEYSHLSHFGKGSATVKVRDEVKKGQEIGAVDLVGYTTRPHLHWMVFKKVGESQYETVKIRTEKPFNYE